MKKTLLALACGLLGTCKISAATPLEPIQLSALAAGGESEFFAELPVVLSVSRLEQPTREAPATVSVITAADIRSSGARDLADLLRMLPGFQVADNIYGAPVAVYHGMTSTRSGRMQVLIDGRSQYSPLWFGGVNWSALQVSLSDIERIEVVRGSNSAAFGANAVLGIVNIQTFSARNAGGGEVSVSRGEKNVSELYATKSWDVGSHAIRVSMERRKTDGLENFPDSRTTERVNLKGEFQVTPDDELRISFGGVSLRQGLGYYPETTTWLGDEPPHDRKINNFYGQVDWRHHLKNGDDFSLRFFRITEKGQESYKGVFDLDENLVADVAANYDYAPRVTRDDLEFQFTSVIGDAARFVAGAGLRYDTVKDSQFYAKRESQKIDLARAFAHGEWRAHSDLLLSLGATVEKDSIAGRTFAPRLAANWFVVPGQTLRASASRAYRSPSLFEQRADVQVRDITGLLTSFLGTDVYQETLSVNHLKPEELTSFDLGYLGEWKSQGLAVDVRAFHEKLNDAIVVYGGSNFPADNITINGMAVWIKGAETQIRWSPVEGTRFWINHAVINIEATMDAMPPGYGIGRWEGLAEYAEESAPHKQSSIHWWQSLFAGLNSSISWYRVGAYKWTKNTVVPEYHRVDFRLAYPFRHDAGDGELALTLRSAGSDHAEYRYTESAATYNKQVVTPSASLTLTLGF